MNEQTSLFADTAPVAKMTHGEPYGASEIRTYDPASDICTRRHRHNANSDAAFETIEARAPSLRERIYEFIAARGKDGATTYEVSEALRLKYPTASARMSELKRDGRIVESGERRATDSACLAAVMRAVGA